MLPHMFLRETRQKRTDGRVITYLQLAESVWSAAKGRSETRVIYNCGRADDPAVSERLRRLAKSILRRASPEEIVAEDPRWQVVNAWPYGDLYVLEALWTRLGIPEVLNEVLGARRVELPVERAGDLLPGGRSVQPRCRPDLLRHHQRALRGRRGGPRGRA